MGFFIIYSLQVNMKIRVIISLLACVVPALNGQEDKNSRKGFFDSFSNIASRFQGKKGFRKDRHVKFTPIKSLSAIAVDTINMRDHLDMGTDDLGSGSLENEEDLNTCESIASGRKFLKRYRWYNVMPCKNFKNFVANRDWASHICDPETQDCSYCSGYDLTQKLREAWGTNKNPISYDQYPTKGALGVKYALNDVAFKKRWLDLNFNKAIYPGNKFQQQTEWLETTDYSQYSNIVLLSMGGCKANYVAVVGISEEGEAYLVIDHKEPDNLYVIKKKVLNRRRWYQCFAFKEWEVYSVGAA